MTKNVPTAAILTIGDELLRGDTVDSNKAFLGAELTARGITVAIALSIPDNIAAIITWVQRLAADYDHVFVSGGIGPTPDDLTRQALANAFDRELVLFADELAAAEKRRGKQANAGVREMWRLPEGCEMIFGDGVVCPGFHLKNVYVFAGVPLIMQAMWHEVADRFKGQRVHTVRFRAGLGESHWAHVMTRFAADHPALKFGSYPKLGQRLSAEIVISGEDQSYVARIATELECNIHRIASERCKAK